MQSPIAIELQISYFVLVEEITNRRVSEYQYFSGTFVMVSDPNSVTKYFKYPKISLEIFSLVFAIALVWLASSMEYSLIIEWHIEHYSKSP